MSWDISIQKFSRIYAAVADIPEDERGLPLGPRALVHEAVSRIFPDTDWSDPGWGTWESEFGSIEFNVGEDPAEGMMLHVRADSRVVPAIVMLCKDNGWQGLDCGSGDLIDQIADRNEGLAAWSAFRDQVLGRSK
jgi:hypothetical protein